MVRLSDGDRTAFPMLVDELWPVLLSFARRGVGGEADAEDIAQEVFYRICSHIADFNPSQDALSWAFGIAHYEIMTHRRRLQRRREVLDETLLPEAVHPALSQEEWMLERELAALFENTLGALADDDRRMLGLLGPVVVDGLGAATLRKRKQRALDVFVLLGLAIWLRWRNRRWLESVTTGLQAGSLPLVVGLILDRLEVQCAFADAASFCAAFGVLIGGATAGMWIGVRESKRSGQLWSWLTAGVIAALAASLGCLRLGAVGFTSVALGIALGVAVTATVARRK